MTVLDDVYEAIKKYPSTYVAIQFIDLDWPGVAINDGEDVQFRFQAANRGPLHMLDVSWKVEGLNGTLIKGNGAGAPYTTTLVTQPGTLPDLPAHHENDPVTWVTLPFTFKPTRVATTPRELVRVSVVDWRSSWDHVFDNHTEADGDAKATYSSTVAVA